MISPDDLDRLLPQTQCGECGHSGCRPYAEALAKGQAPINACPPGGVSTLKALGTTLGIDPTPYVDAMAENTRPPSEAVIREEECIGCTKCIQACPVDAIIGTGKHMHTVLPHECTGCGLCVDPCPVDCIDMIPLSTPRYDKDIARQRAQARSARTLGDQKTAQSTYRTMSQQGKLKSDINDSKQAKQDYIAQAIARAQSKKRHE